jgi:periplasmic divalent cation tolerance protein
MQQENGIVVIFSTVPPDQSKPIAEKLVRTRIAACVNIMPVRSVFTWKEELCREDEHLLIIKTPKEMEVKVKDVLAAIHPYEVPEIIVLPVISGNPPYLGWVHEVTGQCRSPVCREDLTQ